MMSNKPKCERVAEWIVLTKLPFDTASERERKIKDIAFVLHDEFCEAQDAN